jgi:hypothetical protein
MVIIDFPYGKLVKTMLFNIYQENTIIKYQTSWVFYQFIIWEIYNNQ